jgi:hypothetical protein
VYELQPGLTSNELVAVPLLAVLQAAVKTTNTDMTISHHNSEF